MLHKSGSDELDDDETLYRRIPLSWYPDQSCPPPPVAFRPMERDVDGLSFSRAKYTSIEVVAQSPKNPNRKNPVAKLKVKDLRKIGLDLSIDPEDQGHVLAVNMKYAEKLSSQIEEWAERMASELCPGNIVNLVS